MRNERELEELMLLLQGTAEAMGGELKPAALALMASDLEPYPMQAIASALSRCRREARGRLAMADIMERLAGVDGRPEPNEAWAIALQARNEDVTVVWCDEIMEAYWAAAEILKAGDKVGARAAFIEVYSRLLAEARTAGKPAKWSATLGRDPQLRRIAIDQAWERGLLTETQARAMRPLLPAPDEPKPDLPLLPRVSEHPAVSDKWSQRIRALKADLEKKIRAERRTARDRAAEAEQTRAAERRRQAEMFERAKDHPLYETGDAHNGLPPVMETHG